MTNQTITPGTGHLGIAGNIGKILVLGDLELDPNSRFYEYMLAFLVASAGLTAVYDAGTYPNFMKGTAGIFPSKSRGARVDLAACVAAVRHNALPQPQAEMLLSGMLANSAYESLTESEEKRLTGKPTFEMLFHVRNAASHANRWFFRSSQPRYPTHWNGVVIDDRLKGEKNPMHGKSCINDTLMPGDVLFLVRDVELLLQSE